MARDEGTGREQHGPAPKGFRSGFVTIVGRPNVGKSTLLNALLGEKVAIVTPKPQTTRDRIAGIHTDDRSQIVFLDTPGIHKPFKRLNTALVERAVATLSEVDVVLLMIDATEQGGLATPPASAAAGPAAADSGDGAPGAPGAPGVPEGDRHVLEHVANAGKPSILLVNKVDRLRDKSALLPIIDTWRRAHAFVAVVPLSALSGDNLTAVLEETRRLLPEGPYYYDADLYTDRSTRFLVAELIREKVTLRTEKEIPYAVAVEVERFAAADPAKGRQLTEIDAVIHVERDTQKGILIGKGGAMLKRIGTEARADIERLVGHKVVLRLFVRVEAEWSEKQKGLKRFGYVD
jgi:GTP-binding protein Era